MTSVLEVTTNSSKSPSDRFVLTGVVKVIEAVEKEPLFIFTATELPSSRYIGVRAKVPLEAKTTVLAIAVLLRKVTSPRVNTPAPAPAIDGLLLELMIEL